MAALALDDEYTPFTRVDFSQAKTETSHRRRSPNSVAHTIASSRHVRGADMGAPTSASDTMTSIGSFRISVKDTFGSNPTASNVFSRTRAHTNHIYLSISS